MLSDSLNGHQLTRSYVASAGRGLNTPSLGFGARLRNVPSPITTRPLGSSYRPIRPVDMREPRPERQLPSFDETLIELAPIHGNTPSSNAQAPSTFYSSSDQPASEWLSREPQGFCSNDNDDRLKINWYTKRADQIGPSHRIPGLMHLGDLLTPPGWKCGDDPIDEAEAQKVYDEAREKARRALVVSSTESSRAEGPDIEKRLDERDMQWQTQLKLDEYILTEQKRIYNAWKQHRTKQAQQLASQAQKQQQQQHQKQYQQSQQNQHQQQQNLPQYYAKTRVLGRPQPMQPPTETSLLTYQRYRQSQVPASPHLYGPSPPLYGPSSPLYGPSPPLYGPSPPLSGGSLNSRIQILQRGLRDTMPANLPYADLLPLI